MKKTFTFFILLFAFCIFLSACGNKCEHTYDNACDAICNECGEERTVTHTPAEDDGNCTTPVNCSICGIEMAEANKVHSLVYEFEDSSENASVFKSRCTQCQDSGKSTTVTIIIEHSSVTPTEANGLYSDAVFLFTDSAEMYKVYNYSIDAGGREDVYISVYFYADETCEGFFGANRGYTLLEGESYMSLKNQFIGIQVENYSNEPITVTFSIAPKE